MSDAAQPRVFSVSELTSLLKLTIEESFPAVWVGGEISDIARPRSGHIYFTLQDNQAQIRAVMWRSAASRLQFDLDDGMEVICGGGLDLYPPRGSYQLVVRHVEPQGVGARQLALRKLQEKLAAEGLFAPERKRPLPPFPRRIGFVTSPTGAAIRDFCEVLRRRWHGAEVIVIPTRVQGDGVSQEIVAAIRRAAMLRPSPDVLVVGRGGGSVEDLWCFNDEELVRAICAAPMPVVSAVGHEIDVTLADLAADVRALTPTEAAELVVPSSSELLDGLHTLQQRLIICLRTQAAGARSQLEMAHRCRMFRRPLDSVHDRARSLDDHEERLNRAMSVQHRTAAQRVTALADRLDSLSPLSVLARGYSLTEQMPDGSIVRGAGEVALGQQIHTRLNHGGLVSRVEEIIPDVDGKPSNMEKRG
jgi:exodeoxyribonuclease VII large subunit